jgi:hypothetical protein
MPFLDPVGEPFGTAGAKVKWPPALPGRCSSIPGTNLKVSSRLPVTERSLSSSHFTGEFGGRGPIRSADRIESCVLSFRTGFGAVVFGAGRGWRARGGRGSSLRTIPSWGELVPMTVSGLMTVSVGVDRHYLSRVCAKSFVELARSMTVFSLLLPSYTFLRRVLLPMTIPPLGRSSSGQ